MERHRATPSLARRAPLRWMTHLFLAACVVWAFLGIGYAPLGIAPVRWIVATMFLLFAGWSLWKERWRWPAWIALALIAFVFGSRWLIHPSLHRDWTPEVAVMPHVRIDGDRVHITGYRDFHYRGTDDFDIHYEERELRLSDLQSMDFFVSYWWPGPVAHTFVSFDFANADPVAVSIETRPEVGEGFDPIASMFRRFELIYVVGDEQDIVGVRTNYRHEDVYLYRTNTSPEAARRLFQVYAERINALAVRPEFYHLLSNSCTINIVRYANRAGRTGPLDYRHVLNGYSDRYLYRRGFIDTSLPFADLRAMSRINAKAEEAADSPEFSRRIREGLPVPAAR
ncbi:DUF4105 domain-containing protein [Lysobacter sp. KIS68-7]|uniref:lipoprotein N-acyltransferase Lnb domain-containing protein n=1 Tax=Lysobacter sp. KIS68-7 TaxID=2904252 RepID=UPI001E47A451|nr:DUF4105 domain-containing protein [Lysobacter sp. KIS68-7]UHQ19853.1 DUF4105 domain-containing protein [Lysobacter sp. KIS68-7]